MKFLFDHRYVRRNFYARMGAIDFRLWQKNKMTFTKITLIDHGIPRVIQIHWNKMYNYFDF